MQKCLYDCGKKPEWHHVWTYKGRQINERFAIVPVCAFHHRAEGFDPRYCEYISLTRATREELDRYPRKNWTVARRYLENIYGNTQCDACRMKIEPQDRRSMLNKRWYHSDCVTITF